MYLLHLTPVLMCQPMQACLAGGWDVVAAHEASLPRNLGPAERRAEVLTLNRGRALHKQGKGCRRFYILLEVLWPARLC